MPNVKISQLPYVGKTGFTSNDIVPFVNYINPTGTTSETKIDDIKDYVLDNTFIQNIIKVGKGGNVDFTTVSDAINSITGSSSTNRYVIQIGPGFYIEPEISLIGKEYVNLVGSEINSTIILPDLNTNTIFTLGTNNQLSFLTISGATSGVGISCPDCGDFSLIHKVSLFDNDTQISVTSSVVSTQFYGEYVDLNGDYTYGVYVTASNSFTCYVSFENYFNETLGPKPTIANYCSGLGSSLSIQGGAGFGIGTTGSEYLRIEDGADVIISGVNIYSWDYALRNTNNGGACTFDIDGVSIVGSSTYDLSVENPNTFGTIQGSLSHQQINNLSQNVYWGFLDHIDGELDVTRKISVTFKDGTHTDLSTLLFEGGTMGVLEGGVITIVSGLTFSISEGYGYLESIIDNSVIKRYDWLDTPHTLLPNQNQYIYINNNGILSNTGTRPNSTYNIILGRIVTNSTDIIIIDASPLQASHTSNLYGNLFRNALGPIYDSGSIVTENVTPYHLDVTSGDYYYSTNEYLPSGGTDITFTMYYGDGTTGWTTSATTEVVNGWDDGSGTIAPLPTTGFTKHTLYVVGEGINEQYFLVLGQEKYTSLIETENGLLPIPPPYFDDSITQIASIYIQQGQPSIVQIEDIRPVIGFKAGGVNASSLHANLLGLSADDHTQYLLVDGARAMEGDLDMGGNDITNVNRIISNNIKSTTISATTYQNLPVDPDTFVTGFTYNNNVFTVKQNNGQPDLTSVINSVTGWTVNGDLTVTGSTYTKNLIVTGGTQSIFSGNSSSDLVRITQTGSGNAFVVEDSSNPDSSPFVIDNSGSVGIGGTLSVGKTGVTAGNQVDIKSDNNYLNGIYVGGQFITQFPNVGVYANALSIGVYGGIANDGGGIGVYGQTGNAGGESQSGDYIGGKFESFTSGGNRYSLQLLDGTEGVGKFLYSVTSDGKSNWTSQLSGTSLTINGGATITGATSMKSVTATTVSASTLTLISPNVPPTPSVSTPFIDNYDRVTLSPGGTPSLTYTNTNTGGGNSTIVTNYLNLNNGTPAGQSYTTVPLSGFGSPFNPTLSSNNPLSTIEWTFNLRTNRASIFAGFGASSYAGAVVLVGSNTNLQSAGSGYALVYGTTGTRNWKLVKYNNGLAGTQTDIITGGLFAGNTNYVSARVVYTPSTNTWSYYFRDDGASAWGDPTTTSTLIGSAVDSTYTSTLMSVFGVFFNYSTAASQNLQFDNLRVQQSVSASATTIDQLTLKNNSGTDVFKVKDDGTTTMSGTVTSSVGFFGSFSGTHLGNGSSLTLGQSGVMVTGTTALSVTSATTALTLIPGLSTTITVSGQTMVYIQTNGGVNTTSTTISGGSALDIAILVDGAVLAAGGYQRIYADNPTGNATVTNWVANWNTSVLLTLAAGSHTIEVDAVYVAGATATVSGIANSIKQGTLSVMVLKSN
jgi:hypothetical protein